MLIAALKVLIVIIGAVGLIATGVFIQRIVTRKNRKTKKTEKIREKSFKATRQLIQESEKINSKLTDEKKTLQPEEALQYEKIVKNFTKRIAIANKYKIPMPNDIKSIYAVLKARQKIKGGKGIIKSNEVIKDLRRIKVIEDTQEKI